MSGRRSKSYEKAHFQTATQHLGYEVCIGFVVGSHNFSDGSPQRSLVFLHPQIKTLLKSNLIRKQWQKNHFLEVSLLNPVFNKP